MNQIDAFKEGVSFIKTYLDIETETDISYFDRTKFKEF